MEPPVESKVPPPAPCKAQLRGGTEVLIRPLVPSDETQLRMGLEHLSFRSRYQRFLTPTIHLSNAQFDYLVHPDGRDHIALVMAVEEEGEPEPHGIAVARCVRGVGGDPNTAEVAIVVLDEWQGRGAGALLLRHLAAWAHRLSIERWVGVLLATNETVKRAIDHVGPRVDSEPAGNGVTQITWKLEPTAFDVG